MTGRWCVSGIFRAAQLRSTEFPTTKDANSTTPSNSDYPTNYANQLRVKKLKLRREKKGDTHPVGEKYWLVLFSIISPICETSPHGPSFNNRYFIPNSFKNENFKKFPIIIPLTKKKSDPTNTPNQSPTITPINTHPQKNPQN